MHFSCSYIYNGLKYGGEMRIGSSVSSILNFFVFGKLFLGYDYGQSH